MRLNLQNKEDELTNTKGHLKEAKETIQVNNENIEKLSSEVATLNKDLEKEKETNLRKVSIMESAHSSACEKLQKVIEAKDEVIGGKEVSIMELNKERVKIINTGVKAFARCENKGATCDFRLAQEGVLSTVPFIGPSRFFSATLQL